MNKVLIFTAQDKELFIYVDEKKIIHVSSAKSNYEFIKIKYFPLLIMEEVIKKKQNYNLFEKSYAEEYELMKKKVESMKDLEEIYEYIKKEMEKIGLSYKYSIELYEYKKLVGL